ncbi:MAG: hypothetical protein B7X60_03080 [Polynucleobacter sp. 39-45-136]|jgi:predicted ATP-dependent endonuclease of OLD family|nr:MAG: hypothetical protein B7X60_03080 [Polynucleobacter sp. 39-45-136]
MKNLPINSLELSGYRSFGEKAQRFEQFAKVNLFIGQNNCGKSNVLKYIHNHLSDIEPRVRLNSFDRHIGYTGEINYGYRVSAASYDTFITELLSPTHTEIHFQNQETLRRILIKKSYLDSSENGPWIQIKENHTYNLAPWIPAFGDIENQLLVNLWSALTKKSGGSRDQHWIPEILEKIHKPFPRFKSALIPAIREIGEQGSLSEDFSGNGIIERLAKLQNPSPDKQEDKRRFEKIGDFLKNVTGNSSAEIEIPYDRNTIVIHMDGKSLPLESLGSGIHEVIILAAAATVLSDHVICMEEPELHLNPLLQKKLVRYLQEETNNQYLIATHSAALMDADNAEIYHLQLQDGQTIIERVSSNQARSNICHDLGYHPSDLLQSNSIIWVEGPSDRIYLNWWIRHLDPGLIEGIHYSIMFYGGRLASHLSAEDIDASLLDLISLRHLNRRSAVVIDSDKTNPHSKINATKLRLKDEFTADFGSAWITSGREIENYIQPKYLRDAINTVHPSYSVASKMGKFENCLTVKSKKGQEIQASKVEIAKNITEQHEPDLNILDLRRQLETLISFIKESNPSDSLK